MVSEQEILKAACGVDEEQESNSIVKVEAKILHFEEDGSEEPVSDVTLDGPCVNLHRGYRYTMIDLQFDEDNDPDFIRLSDMLRDFTVPEQSMDAGNDRIPAIVLTVMPKVYDGEYFICGMYGAWCLMPSEEGGSSDTVRFIFENELVHTYRINTDLLEQEEDGQNPDYFEEREDGYPEDYPGDMEYLTDFERTEDTEYEEE